MPREFKTLASITVWILFSSGCITVFVNIISWVGLVVRVGLTGTPDAAMFGGWVLGYATLFLSVVAAKLRQMLE